MRRKARSLAASGSNGRHWHQELHTQWQRQQRAARPGGRGFQVGACPLSSDGPSPDLALWPPLQVFTPELEGAELALVCAGSVCWA